MKTYRGIITVIVNALSIALVVDFVGYLTWFTYETQTAYEIFWQNFLRVSVCVLLAYGFHSLKIEK